MISEKEDDNKIKKKEVIPKKDESQRQERPISSVNLNPSQNTAPQKNSLWRLVKTELIDPFNKSEYKKEILFCLSVFGILLLISKLSGSR